MKKNLFICDFCGKQQECSKDEYPYKDGWVYIWKSEIKVGAYSQCLKYEDKHFCCNDCLANYIKQELEKVKGGSNDENKRED